MKRRLLLAILTVGALLVMAAPALAYSHSSSWSFSMTYCFVSGKDNGAFKYMTAGRMTNSGYIYVSSAMVGATNCTVHIDVYRNVTGVDPCVGSSSVAPGTTVNVKKYFTTYCGSQPTDDYYLEIWRAYPYGTVIKGAGTLRTQ